MVLTSGNIVNLSIYELKSSNWTDTNGTNNTQIQAEIVVKKAMETQTINCLTFYCYNCKYVIYGQSLPRQITFKVLISPCSEQFSISQGLFFIRKLPYNVHDLEQNKYYYYL